MAGAGITYELQGVRGFEEQLAQASSVMRRQCEIACQDTARLIANGARARAPRDTGDLQFAITFEGKGLNWRVGLRDGTIPSRGGSNTAHLNPWVYGVWYEYGFVTRNIRTTPYMRPAAEAQDAAHVARITAAVHVGLRKVA